MEDDLEQRIQERTRAGDLRGAATLALDGYGPELLGYLVATCRDRALADEIFAMTCEDLWRGLPGFRWSSSMRTWLYVLARHAHARARRASHARPRASVSEIADVEARVRTATAPWLRTEVKDRFDAMRDELDEDERALLVLRVDRRLSWAEIATVLGEDGAGAQARVRKRFSLLKARLHARAAELFDEK